MLPEGASAGAGAAVAAGWGVGLGGMEAGVFRGVALGGTEVCVFRGVALGGTEASVSRGTKLGGVDVAAATSASGVGLGGTGVEEVEIGRMQLAKNRTKITDETKIEQNLDREIERLGNMEYSSFRIKPTRIIAQEAALWEMKVLLAARHAAAGCLASQISKGGA